MNNLPLPTHGPLEVVKFPNQRKQLNYQLKTSEETHIGSLSQFLICWIVGQLLYIHKKKQYACVKTFTQLAGYSCTLRK